MGAIRNPGVIWKALDEAAREVPNDRMYIYKDHAISFREVDEASDRVATWLLKRGVSKGDRIGIIALNQPEWLYTYFAAAKIGAAIVGLNVRYRDTELDYMLNQSEASMVVVVNEFGGLLWSEQNGRCNASYVPSGAGPPLQQPGDNIGSQHLSGMYVRRAVILDAASRGMARL